MEKAEKQILVFGEITREITNRMKRNHVFSSNAFGGFHRKVLLDFGRKSGINEGIWRSLD